MRHVGNWHVTCRDVEDDAIITEVTGDLIIAAGLVVSLIGPLEVRGSLIVHERTLLIMPRLNVLDGALTVRSRSRVMLDVLPKCRSLVLGYKAFLRTPLLGDVGMTDVHHTAQVITPGIVSPVDVSAPCGWAETGRPRS